MNQRELRVIMTRELTEISLTRKQLAEQMIKDVLNNFTNSEIGMIANAIKEWSGMRLLQLIKR